MAGLVTALPFVIELVDRCMLYKIPATVVNPDVLDGLQSWFNMIDLHEAFIDSSPLSPHLISIISAALFYPISSSQ